MAIAFAVGCPDIELLGITTVAGNVGLDKTTANALRVRDFLGARDVPVTPGSAVPLLRPAITAEHVHGADGLGGARLPPAASQPNSGHATDFMIDTAMAAPGEIALVAIGPLTNIALALRREPALATSVQDFVIMGGSTTRVNVTPAAEFNIAADPEAAAVVFAAGWRVTMVGLDVTLQATADTAVRTRLGVLGRLAEELLLPSLGRYVDSGLELTSDLPDPAVHDVVAVAHVAHPGLLGCSVARVEVEIAGRWTAGMTVTDFSTPPADCNALVATSIDVAGFWDSVLAAYAPLATV